MPAVISRHPYWAKTTDAVIEPLVTNVRVLATTEASTGSSETSLEKSFYFGARKKYHSEPAFPVTFDTEMPDWSSGFEQNQTRARNIPEFLAGGNFGYKNEVYVAAAAIFERLAVRKEVGQCLVQYPPIEENVILPSFGSQQIKRQAYELCYETLKYQELLEDILADSDYFLSHPSGDDTSALIMVMLFDFQNRRWGPRCHVIGDPEVKDINEVESVLMDHRVHLAASLARLRVKHQSRSIDFILPEDVRKQEKCASDLPQYAWVNTMKISVENMILELEDLQYEEFLDSDILIPAKGKRFRRDRHCEDVLIFPADQKEPLKCLQLVVHKYLILQDKTSSLAVMSAHALLSNDDDCDLIHTNVASGLTTAHLAILLYNQAKNKQEAREMLYGKTRTSATKVKPRSTRRSVSPVENYSGPKVIAFGVQSEQHKQELTELFQKMQVCNVELMSEQFERVEPQKEQQFYKKAKVVLITPQCTRTAVANPIEFMLNEGDSENYKMLRDMSQGELHKRAVKAGLYHTETLKVAMQFPDVLAIVYATRSVHSQENEQAVNNAVKWHRETSDSKRPFRMNPPTLPILSSDIKEDASPIAKHRHTSSDSLKHNFLRIRQHSQMNGCFIAVLSRELDPNDQAAIKDMIRRTALQGLIVPVKKATVEIKKDTAAEEAVPIHPLPQKKKPQSSHKFVHKYSTPIRKQFSVGKVSASKHVESTDVDKLLNKYEKAQQDKQKINHFSFDAANIAKPPQSQDQRTTSVQAKELQFGKLPSKNSGKK